MAFDKVIDSVQLDNDLRGVADSIRAKAGTTEELEFPKGFKNAVDNIPTGGGEEFFGIRYLELDSAYGLPQTVDLRNIPKPSRGALHYSFSNYGAGTGGGFYTEMKTVYLPDWIDTIGIQMFNNCRSLENIYGDVSNIGIIDGQAFAGCFSLKTIPYMPKLYNIQGNAFNRCTGLTKISLPSTMKTLTSSAFANCTGLTDIYCGFAEGAVANAPWSAINAKIHYNTQFDENGNPITE